MTNLQRGQWFCVGLASGFFAACVVFANERGELYSRTAMLLLAALCGSAAYAIYSIVRAWRARSADASRQRRLATLLWGAVAFAALSAWPHGVQPYVDPFGTWCSVSSLVAAVTAWTSA